MNRVTVSFELSGAGLETRYYQICLWLSYYDAWQVSTAEWALFTWMSVDQIKWQLGALTAPGDRLTVKRGGQMAVRIPIRGDNFGMGSA